MSKECMFLDEWKHCDICEKLIKTKDGANGKKREHLLTEEDLRCDFYKDCYYKQKEKYKNALKEIKEHCRVYLRPKHKREYDEKMGGYFASNVEEIINEVLNA